MSILTAVHVLYHRYLESVRRFNYTTPKSYLELISLYKGLLEKKRAELRANKERLENGVDKISQASAQASLPDPNTLLLLNSKHEPLTHPSALCLLVASMAGAEAVNVPFTAMLQAHMCACHSLTTQRMGQSRFACFCCQCRHA